MASNCDFDPSIFASDYLREEDTPELCLNYDIKPATLLEHTKEATIGKPSLLSRTFKRITQGDDTQDEKHRMFRVMQWNILAQSLSSGSDNFVRCPEEALQWTFRRQRLLEEVLRVDPDILCMQEVDHFGFFLPVMKKIGYNGSFFPKPKSPCMYASKTNGPDGCAIFFKISKFRNIGKKSIVLYLGSTKEITNQVAIMYKLARKDRPECEITIATTHLKAKLGWEDMRKLQGSYLLNYLRSETGDKPLMVCGDFNAECTEPVYKLFSTDPLRLNSAYTKLNEPHGSEPPYTTWKIRGAGGGKESDVCHTIDYMWYTEKSIGLKSLYNFPTGEQMGPNRVPSFQYPSDHFSLAADFMLL